MRPRKVFVAIPSHDKRLHVCTLTSLINELNPLALQGIEVGVYCWEGDSLLPHARNVLIGKFLESDCDDLVFIDSDVSWAPGQLQKLLSHEADFVAGVYRSKCDDEKYPVCWLAHEPPPNAVGLIEAAGVPAGFFRMTRAGLQRVIAQVPELQYRSHNAPDTPCWYLFDIELRNGRAWGEDYVFCFRIRALGEKVYVDPSLLLGHAGTKEYRGILADYLAADHLAHEAPLKDKAA